MNLLIFNKFSVEEVPQTETMDKKPRNASTVTNQDTLQGAVPSEKTPQLQSAPQRFRIQERHSDISVTEKDEVEYFIKFSNNYEKKSGKSLVNVKGNLRKHSWFWTNVLHANDFIMNVINFGYIIPFVTHPTPNLMKNNRPALQHSDFVEKTIKELLDNNCITEVKCPYVVNPLSVGK